jgi:uncharacterized repeat protein (TIGR03803 family)
VILGAGGALYGTTAGGGRYQANYCDYLLGSPGCGTVFTLMPSKKGRYTERVLWSFGGNAADGIKPEASLIENSMGSLYGTTSAGGGTYCDGGCGTVFKLLPRQGSSYGSVYVTAL